MEPLRDTQANSTIKPKEPSSKLFTEQTTTGDDIRTNNTLETSNHGESLEDMQETPASNEEVFLIPYDDEPMEQLPQVSTDPNSSAVFSTAEKSIKSTETIQHSDLEITVSEKTESSAESIKTVSFQSMIEKHILKEDTVVKMSSCAAMVSGIENSGKTNMLLQLIHHSVRTKQNMEITPLMEKISKKKKEILTKYELIILGKAPFDELSWTISTCKYDVATLTLLPYFVNFCKHRFDTLKFEPISEAMDCKTSITDADGIHELKQLYKDLMDAWVRLQKDDKFRDVIPEGASVINVFDVGPSKAAQDFLPFMNRYCKRSLHLTCYNPTTDAEELIEESNDGSENSKSNQMLKQLKGCMNPEQVVIVTSIENEHDNSPKNENAIKEIKEKIKKSIGTEKVKQLTIKKEIKEYNKTKKFLERIVLDDPHKRHHQAVFLREIALLQTLRKKTKSFWMKRTEIELLSEQYRFKNGKLGDFFRKLTTIGSILYVHDIPALDDYVITDIAEFVMYAHKLYNQEQDENKLSKYGLFKDTNEEDTKILLKFLTVFGIAVEISSTQIDFPSPEEMEPLYYYIPSACSTAIAQPPKTDEDSIVISFNDCIAENLQALLCNEALRLGGRLIPTETRDTTIEVQFADDGTNARIKITGIGKNAKLTILHDAKLPIEHKVKIYSRVLSAYPSLITRSCSKPRYQIVKVTEGSVQTLIDAIKCFQMEQNALPYAKSPDRDMHQMTDLVKMVTEKYRNKIPQLMSILKISEEKQKEYNTYKSEVKVMYIVLDFARTVNEEQFKATLTKLGWPAYQ